MKNAGQPQTDERPFEIVPPAIWAAPCIFSSPHSGRDYASAFLAASRLSAQTLRRSEDCYVDELFGCAPELGAPLLKANFPRSYLDVNREPYELDPRMFVEDLPGYANSSSIRVAGGLGTIPRVVGEGEEIYRGRMRLSEALRRIDAGYRPYHRALAALIGESTRVFGNAVLLDCHSMPSSCSGQAKCADVVLGDRHGVASGEEITALVEDLLKAQGLNPIRNKPYAGGFITQNYGNPGNGTHALQIEINRNIYMDERTLEKSAGFAALKTIIRRVVGSLIDELPDLLKPLKVAAE